MEAMVNEDKNIHSIFDLSWVKNVEQLTVRGYRGFCMNTGITFRVFGEKADAAIKHAMAELIRLEKALSRFLPGSEVAGINKSAGKGHIKISPETYEILSYSLFISRKTQGLFDITISPLVDLWDYKHSLHAPKKREVRRVLSLVSYHDLVLNSEEKTAGLGKPGQSIDLGGIAKGYASDCIIDLLRKYNVTSAFVNIGGNVSTLGNKPDGTSWSVGIRHPRREGCLLGAVKVTGKAVVTSGDYERYFIDREGKRWHHILSPVTGYPAEAGLISVTVAADSAMTADALSTAVFIAGMDKGLGILSDFPGAEAVLVNNRQQIYITQGLKECYEAAEGLNPILI